MRDALGTPLLLALLDVGSPGITGTEVQARLADRRKPPRADQLLVALLKLETTGHVAVERGDVMRFALTDAGRERAYEVGGGQPVHVRLLMADLVGFTTYTATHGDPAGRAAAGALHLAASDALRSAQGAVVKSMGDGVLGWLPPTADVGPVVAAIAAGCGRPDGSRWELRAATHVGRPIRHGGDLFGTDVNLVARLCDVAEPGQLVCSDRGAGDPEVVDVRGFDAPVSIWRTVIA